MENIKVNLFLVSIVTAAFLWGYQKENIRSSFFSQTNSEQGNEEARTPSAAPSPLATPANPATSPQASHVGALKPSATPGVISAPSRLPKTRNSPTPFPSPSFPARRESAASPQASPSPYGFRSPASNSGNPSNPYQEFLRKRSGQNTKQNSGLSDTMNSINSGGIQDKQISRRNAYFEKLSQQLKDLKGEQAPSPDQPDSENTNTQANDANETLPSENPEILADEDELGGEEFIEDEQLAEEEFDDFEEPLQ